MNDNDVLEPGDKVIVTSWDRVSWYLIEEGDKGWKDCKNARYLTVYDYMNTLGEYCLISPNGWIIDVPRDDVKRYWKAGDKVVVEYGHGEIIPGLGVKVRRLWKDKTQVWEVENYRYDDSKDNLNLCVKNDASLTMWVSDKYVRKWHGPKAKGDSTMDKSGKVRSGQTVMLKQNNTAIKVYYNEENGVFERLNGVRSREIWKVTNRCFGIYGVDTRRNVVLQSVDDSAIFAIAKKDDYEVCSGCTRERLENLKHALDKWQRVVYALDAAQKRRNENCTYCDEYLGWNKGDDDAEECPLSEACGACRPGAEDKSYEMSDVGRVLMHAKHIQNAIERDIEKKEREVMK